MTPPPPAPPPHPPPAQRQGVRCPRCDSSNTKFCYYNNYSLSQPRHFCKTCRRYWTQGGSLRNIPLGGASRKIKKPSLSSSSSSIFSAAGINPLAGISPSPEFQLAGLGRLYPPNLSPFGDHLNLTKAAAASGPPNYYWYGGGGEMNNVVGNKDKIYQKNEGGRGGGVGPVGPSDVMNNLFFENLEEEEEVTNVPHFHHHSDDVFAGRNNNHGEEEDDDDDDEISTKWLFGGGGGGGGGSSSCSNANNNNGENENSNARISSSLKRWMSW